MIFCAPTVALALPVRAKICAPNAHLNTVSLYDALDNRIGMDENGTQTWTLYDSGNPIMDFNSSGSLITRYLWGPMGIVARQTSGGTVSWYLADALGTVRDLINNSGAVIDHVDFSAFGTVLDESNPTNGDRMMGFAGMERDTVTGLNLAVLREQSPGTGRWTSEDPLGFGGSDSDLYRYAANDSINLSDAWGLKFKRRDLIGIDAENAILEDLANHLGVPVKTLDPIRKSLLWRAIARSNRVVWVQFLVLNPRYGGTTVEQDDGTICVTVDPSKWISRVPPGAKRTPKALLWNFLHELIHAALMLGFRPVVIDRNGNVKPVYDKPTDPDYQETNYPLVPGAGRSDLNNNGEQYIDLLVGQLPKLPAEIPDGADHEDPPKRGNAE